MSERFGLKAITIEKIISVFVKSKKIEKVILYGSRAIGKQKSASDIDLTLIAPQMTLSELLQIENEIDDLLLPYKVDLSLYHQIDNPKLIEHIEKVGVEFKLP